MLGDMIAVLEKALGKKAIRQSLPAQKGDMDKTVSDISKAKRLLGYEPKTSFEQGIKKFLKWKRGGEA